MLRKWLIKKDEEAVSPVIAIILMVAITVVLAGVLYVWVTSLADTGDTVESLTLSGKLEVDATDDKAKLTVNHDGGPKVTWADYKVTVGGIVFTVSNTTTTAEVGSASYFTKDGGGFAVDAEYEVKIIKTEDQKIVWQKKLIGVTADL